MKKILISAAALIVIFGFTIQTIKKNTAEVNQVSGYYIFTDCKPTQEYTYLGEIKSSGSFGGSQYADVRDRLIKKAAKEYPKADGLIFTFVSGSADKCEAIMFK